MDVLPQPPVETSRSACRVRLPSAPSALISTAGGTARPWSVGRLSAGAGTTTWNRRESPTRAGSGVLAGWLLPSAVSDRRWARNEAQDAVGRGLLPSWLPTSPIGTDADGPRNDRIPLQKRDSVRRARKDSNL